MNKLNIILVQASSLSGFAFFVLFAQNLCTFKIFVKVNVQLLNIIHSLLNSHRIIFIFNVQILKHDWPARWQSFIPDLVSAAKTSETICENCMAILKVSLYSFLF